MRTTTVHHGVFFILILGIAAWLRLSGLGEESLWNDELSTWKRAQFHTTTEVIHHAIQYDVHPPGYQLIMQYWSTLFPAKHEGILRFPSALAGIVSVVLLFFWVRRHSTTPTALLAAWLLALLPVAIYYSKEARSYSLVLCFSVALISLSDKAERWPIWLFILSTSITASLLAYLHYFGLLFVCLFLVMQMMLRTHERKSWVIISLLSCLSYLPWLPFLWKHQALGPIYIEPVSFSDAYRWVRWVLFQSNTIVMGLITLGLYQLIRHRFSEQQTQFIRQWGLFIALFWSCAYLISVLHLPVLSFQNMMPVLPLVLVLSAMITAHSLKHHRWAIVLVAALVPLLALQHQFPKKQDWRAAVAYAEKRSNDTLPVFGYVWDMDYLNYYRSSETLHWQSIDNLNHQTTPRFVFIQMHRAEPVLDALITTVPCFLEDEKPFIGGKVMVVDCASR